MPLLGAHMSIAGGPARAFPRLARIGGESMQIFVKNQRQWRASPLDQAEASLFRQLWRENGQPPVAAHNTYLINLASPDAPLAEKSVLALADELDRAAQLAIPYLIMHPGSHGGDGVEAGLARLLVNLDRTFALAGPENKVMVLIETTAGQGTGLGSRFEEIAHLLAGSRYSDRLGVCLDTCHIFAAGYDLRTPAAYHRTIQAFDEIIGLDRLKFFHLNDARKELGSKVDRHEHIGAGRIGLDGFRHLLTDPRFARHPMVLETPKSKDLAEDRRNLATLRSLLTSPA